MPSIYTMRMLCVQVENIAYRSNITIDASDVIISEGSIRIAITTTHKTHGVEQYAFYYSNKGDLINVERIAIGDDNWVGVRKVDIECFHEAPYNCEDGCMIKR